MIYVRFIFGEDLFVVDWNELKWNETGIQRMRRLAPGSSSYQNSVFSLIRSVAPKCYQLATWGSLHIALYILTLCLSEHFLSFSQHIKRERDDRNLSIFANINLLLKIDAMQRCNFSGHLVKRHPSCCTLKEFNLIFDNF